VRQGASFEDREQVAAARRKTAGVDGLLTAARQTAQAVGRGVARRAVLASGLGMHHEHARRQREERRQERRQER
jgi:hypothetical protein